MITMRNNEEERKDFWIVTVQQEVIQKVVFNEPLTLSEAVEAYNSGDYYDILDEEVIGDENVVEIK